MAPILVFTDLDGSLLDERTYSAAAAANALRALHADGAAVVFCSSKTAAEQRAVRWDLGLPPAPFIVENGAAVCVPAGCDLPVEAWPRATDAPGERRKALGPPRATVLAGVGRAMFTSGVRVRGYTEMAIDEVAELTGLERMGAARAVHREFSETLVNSFPGDTWPRFEAALRREGLIGRHGGRFRTVTGAEADKGHAVRLVTELYRAALGLAPLTIGIGDSANDEGLLLAVDRPYLLARSPGVWTPLEIPGLRRMPSPGPEGWREAIGEVLAEQRAAIGRQSDVVGTSRSS